MKKRIGWVVVAVLVMVRAAVAQQADQTVWVQIEAHPSLTVAEERARRYAAEMPDVNGFWLGGSWYGIALGPYAPEDAQQVLRVYRSEGKIPRDSYITGSSTYDRQFYPLGTNLLDNAPAALPLDPPAQAPAGQAPVAQAPAEPVDETPAQARASERLLSGPERQDLQRALQVAGFYNAGIDGAFGAGTRRSMGEWQRFNGHEATGVLTTRQRAQLMEQYNAPLTSVGMTYHSDIRAGIAAQMPLGAVEFARYQSPLAHYDATTDDGIRLLLISQPGDAANLYGLYDILQTLEIVPLDGPRERGRDGFTIEGRNARILTHAEASLQDGEIKGFVLVWPAGDDSRRARVLDAIKTSFTRLPGTLDPLAGAEQEQRVDLVSGLQVRRPRATGSGFFVDRSGAVVTSAATVEGCTRITLDDDYEATLATSDATLGVAVLRPTDRLAPMEIARLSGLLPRLQSEIAVAGYSFGGALGAPTLTFGTLSDTSGLSGETELTRLALVAQPGDAGGPVFDAGGSVVGMLLPEQGGARQLPADVRFAAKSEAITALLSQAGLGAASGSAGQAVAPQDLMRLAEGMTVLVSCWD
ncbi:trypsin-like peptidase domain-containing protein [Marinibacterium sp. SX1]|uniref:trypsin-like peptidase domain-containing protein n=1 Tax=Marinibacterium sp. SX1 TaxID=3388424 RepID=UPI003D172579